MTLSEIKNKVYFLTNTTSATYPDSDLLASINEWYRIVATWIWASSSSWEFDDSNQTTLPIAISALVANQAVYSLPSDAFDIERVEIQDESGNWHLLERIDKSQVGVALNQLYSTPGIPLAYDISGRTLTLYPVPSYSREDALKVYVSRQVRPLANDTDEPGFDQRFHRLIALGAALDWAIAYQDNQLAQQLRAEIYGDGRIMGLKPLLEKTFGKVNKPSRIIPRIEKYE